MLKLKYDTAGAGKSLEFQNYSTDDQALKLDGSVDDPDYTAQVTVFDVNGHLYLADRTEVSENDRQTKNFPFRVDNDDIDENGQPDYLDLDLHYGVQNVIKIVVDQPNPTTDLTFKFQTGGLSAFDGGGTVYRETAPGLYEVYTGDDIDASALPATFLWQGGKYGFLQGKCVFTPDSSFTIKKTIEIDLRGHEVEPKITVPDSFNGSGVNCVQYATDDKNGMTFWINRIKTGENGAAMIGFLQTISNVEIVRVSGDIKESDWNAICAISVRRMIYLIRSETAQTIRLGGDGRFPEKQLDRSK